MSYFKPDAHQSSSHCCWDWRIQNYDTGQRKFWFPLRGYRRAARTRLRLDDKKKSFTYECVSVRSHERWVEKLSAKWRRRVLWCDRVFYLFVYYQSVFVVIYYADIWDIRALWLTERTNRPLVIPSSLFFRFKATLVDEKLQFTNTDWLQFGLPTNK